MGGSARAAHVLHAFISGRAQAILPNSAPVYPCTYAEHFDTISDDGPEPAPKSSTLPVPVARNDSVGNAMRPLGAKPRRTTRNAAIDRMTKRGDSGDKYLGPFSVHPDRDDGQKYGRDDKVPVSEIPRVGEIYVGLHCWPVCLALARMLGGRTERRQSNATKPP